jgi:thymidine phosphorylase
VHRAPVVQPFVAKSAGKVKKMDPGTLDRASLPLAGGRQTAEDAIDFAVGLSGIKKIGERAETKEPLLLVHARNDQTLRAVLPLLEKAVEVG